MMTLHGDRPHCRISVPFCFEYLAAFPHRRLVRTPCFCFFSPYLLWAVEGSASWRIPLGVQLIPGIALAIGCIFLPPSPRLLVAQGRNGEALRTLARLRSRSEHEVQDDPLLQVRCFVFDHFPHPLCCAPGSWPLSFHVLLFRYSLFLSLPQLSCSGFSEGLTFICFVLYPSVCPLGTPYDL